MEAGNDEFGELYYDVLEPFSLHNKNAEHPRKPEETRSPSSDDVRRAEQAGKEVVGTVRLEIYLGSRRVSENTFVFSIGGGGNKIGSSEFNQSENAATGGGGCGGGGRGLNSDPGLPETSRSERGGEIGADDAGQELNLEPDPSEKIEIENGDGANSDSKFDWLYGEAAGKRETHGADIILDEASSEDEVDQTDSLVDGPCTVVQPGMGRVASEEGELSHNADMDIAPNSAEAIVVQLPCSQAVASDGGSQAMRRGGEVAMVTTASTHARYQAGAGAGVKPRPNGNSSYLYYPRTSLLELDLDGLEHRPWRHPSVDASRYFNYGLDEAAWKTYCQDFRNLMQRNGRPIQVECQNRLRDRPPSVKLAPRDSTATIQIVAKDKASTLGSQRGDRESRPGAATVRSCDHEKDSKRAKVVQESSGDNDDVSDNEWMCRNVGVDSWFHPVRRHEADDRRGFRKGRSKLERWTRHDEDDDNTSTSSMSPPSRVP